MNAWTPPPPEPTAPPPGDADRALLDHQLQLLTRLAEAGLNVALAIERRAARTADAPPDEASNLPTPFGGDLALAFARVSRAVRMTIALQNRLIAEPPAPRAARRPGRASGRAGEATPPPGDFATIEDYIFELDRLKEGERLENLRDREELKRRPIWEILDQLGRDMDLADEAAAREAELAPSPPAVIPAEARRGGGTQPISPHGLPGSRAGAAGPLARDDGDGIVRDGEPEDDAESGEDGEDWAVGEDWVEGEAWYDERALSATPPPPARPSDPPPCASGSPSPASGPGPVRTPPGPPSAGVPPPAPRPG